MNPKKCVFGVPKGKLLGYIVFERGIETNPEKIAAISNMGPIRNVKGVQRLTGCLAALSRFISRLDEQGMPLYKLLKRTDAFVWTKEAQQALESLKTSLMSAPILIAPERGEPLLLYVAASNHVVSAALVVEREEPGHQLKVQRPVYFIGEVLTDPKVWYPQVQKLLYAVLMATRKLLHYFIDHEVTVVTSYPLGDIIHNRDATRQISKWALELMGHDIRYTTRTAIKSQALTDFVAEWTEFQLPTLDVTHEYWTMYFDGSVMAPGSGARVVLISPDRSRLRYAIRLHFSASNNAVEYEALINGLRITIMLSAT